MPVLVLKEHLGKRQTWTKNDSVEHLGLTVQHGVPSLPAGRASTDLLCELAQAVSGLPGNMEAILLAVVLPKLLWSAPLVPAVEQRLVDSSCGRAGAAARGGVKVGFGPTTSLCTLALRVL